MASDNGTSFLKRLYDMVVRYAKAALERYRNLPLLGKVLIWGWILVEILLLILVILITPARIAQFLHDQAKQLAQTKFGWLVLEGVFVVISLPPMPGHTTLVTLCGFAYGMKGFLIASSGSIIGSALSFTLLRYLFAERISSWSSQNEKWQALESVVKAKGLPLIVLIRISPFPPWVYSNSLFASIEPVALWQFAFATVFTFPKILLHVFIGKSMAELSDGDSRDHMTTVTKVLDVVFIVGGIIIAVFSGWLVYTLVQGHIRKLEGLPARVDTMAAEAIEHFDEEAPLLPSSPRQPNH